MNVNTVSQRRRIISTTTLRGAHPASQPASQPLLHRCSRSSHALTVPAAIEAAGGIDAVTPFLPGALASPSEPVRHAAARIAAKYAATPSLAGAVVGKLLPALTSSLADESVSIADHAAKALETLAVDHHQHLAAPELAARTSAVLSALHSMWVGYEQAHSVGSSSSSAVIHLRVLTCASHIMRSSDAAVAAAQSSGVLRLLLDAASRDDDILLQVNVIDLLPPLAASRAGFTALSAGPDRGVWGRLLSWSGVSAESARGPNGHPPPPPPPEMDSILGATALSAVGDVYAAVVEWSTPTEAHVLLSPVLPGLLTVIEAALSNSGSAQHEALIAMGALAVMAAADPCVVDAVLARPLLLREWMECGAASSPELRAATFSTLARILRAARGALHRVAAAAAAAVSSGSGAAADGAAAPAVSLAADYVPAVSDLARYFALVDALGRCCLPRDAAAAGGGGIAVAIAACLRPIPEPRLAALDMLAAVGGLPAPGGVQRLFGCPGATDFLLDRSSESSMGGREAKWAVVDAVLSNSAMTGCVSLKALVGEGLTEALRAFHAGGPHAPSPRGPARVDIMQL